MKKLFALTLLTLALAVNAATTSTPLSAEQWLLKREDTTIGAPYATLPLCTAARDVFNEAERVRKAASTYSANYTCLSPRSARVTSTAPVPPPPAPAPAPAPSGTWTTVAIEDENFTLSTASQIRYGYNGNGFAPDVWGAVITLPAGTYNCGNAINWPVDPKPGNQKQCQVLATPSPPPAPAPSPAPSPSPAPAPSVYQNQYVPVDAAAVAAANNKYKVGTSYRNPVLGWSGPMLIATSEVAPVSDIGAFRTGCQVVKHDWIDPVVYPGIDGVSHLHTFFGNTGISYNSTSASIAATGNSTCRGGTINRSSYWVPSLIDIRTGVPQDPMFESNFYYKSGYAIDQAKSPIVDLPPGLRMIAGDASCTSASCQTAGLFSCAWSGGNSNWYASIPPKSACQINGFSWLIVGIDFPQCWNGLLDSPDHKSHMTNPVNVGANNSGNCPTSHPYALPQIAYQILYRYDNKDANWFDNIRLSSDKYPTTSPGGYSMHGDYVMGWGNDAQGVPVVPVWTQKCDREKKDCHSHLLGDGRAMVIP